MAFLRKEKCFWSAPINEGSDSTYRVAAAFTQFAGGNTKCFSTYHAEFPKPKRDPASMSFFTIMQLCNSANKNTFYLVVIVLQWLMGFRLKFEGFGFVALNSKVNLLR